MYNEYHYAKNNEVIAAGYHNGENMCILSTTINNA